MSQSTTPAGADKLQLQIKDAGAWRNIVTFSKPNKNGVLKASADLLRTLEEPHISMRVVQGGAPLYFCTGPAFMWMPAGDCGVAAIGDAGSTGKAILGPEDC